MNRVIRWILASVMVAVLAGCQAPQQSCPAQQGSGNAAGKCSSDKKCCAKQEGEKAGCSKSCDKAACPKAAAEKK